MPFKPNVAIDTLESKLMPEISHTFLKKYFFFIFLLLRGSLTLDVLSHFKIKLSDIRRRDVNVPRSGNADTDGYIPV